jgi:hypothetical protein
MSSSFIALNAAMRSSDIRGRLFGSNTNLTSPVFFSLIIGCPPRRKNSYVLASNRIGHEEIKPIHKSDDVPTLFPIVFAVIDPFCLN